MLSSDHRWRQDPRRGERLCCAFVLGANVKGPQSAAFTHTRHIHAKRQESDSNIHSHTRSEENIGDHVRCLGGEASEDRLRGQRKEGWRVGKEGWTEAIKEIDGCR